MSKKSDNHQHFQHKLTAPEAADLAYWEDRLTKEGLSNYAGTHANLCYVENTDDYQERKNKVGSNGGRLATYALGDRQSLTLECLQCKRSYTAKHKDAAFCSNACKKAGHYQSSPARPRQYCKCCGMRFTPIHKRDMFCTPKCRLKEWRYVKRMSGTQKSTL